MYARRRSPASPQPPPPSSRRFNDPASPLRVCFVIKQLAVGINLIGANHLILLEPHYNPGMDKQAMERIHRDGGLASHPAPRLGSPPRSRASHV